MDEKDLKIQELEKQLQAKDGEYQEKIKTLSDQIKERDRVIEEKNSDIVGLRRQNTRIKELTEEEKKELDAEKLAEYEEKMRLQAQIDEMKKESEQAMQKEIESRKGEIFKRYAKDEDTLEKIKFNFDRIKGSETASTPEEIDRLARESFFMLGNGAPDINPVQANLGAQGDDGIGQGGDKEDFSSKDEGKQLGNLMNLNLED